MRATPLQGAQKVALLTRPAQARRDAPFPMHRFRIVQTLNVPQRVRLGPSLAAALLDGLFEHPAGVFSCCGTRPDYRNTVLLSVVFPQPSGGERLGASG